MFVSIFRLLLFLLSIPAFLLRFLVFAGFFSLTLLFDAAYLPLFHLPLLLSVLVNGELQTQIPWTAVSDMMDNWAVTLSGEDVFARRQDVWDAANFLRSVPGHVHCICEVQLILKEYLDQRKATRKFMAACVYLQHADHSPRLFSPSDGPYKILRCHDMAPETMALDVFTNYGEMILESNEEPDGADLDKDRSATSSLSAAFETLSTVKLAQLNDALPSASFTTLMSAAAACPPKPKTEQMRLHKKNVTAIWAKLFMSNFSPSSATWATTAAPCTILNHSPTAEMAKQPILHRKRAPGSPIHTQRHSHYPLLNHLTW